MSENEQKITGEMTLGDVIQKYPETIPVFFKFGLHCIGCHISAFESIKDGALAHGADSDALVKELNETINKIPKG